MVTPTSVSQGKNIDHLKCTICLAPVMRKVQTVWCGHSFCFNCIQQAVANKLACPLCRKEIRPIFGLSQDPDSPSPELVAEIIKQNKDLQRECDQYYQDHPDEAKSQDDEEKKNIARVTVTSTTHEVDAQDLQLTQANLGGTAQLLQNAAARMQAGATLSTRTSVTIHQSEAAQKQIEDAFNAGFNRGAQKAQQAERKAWVIQLGVLAAAYFIYSLYNRIFSD